MESITIPEIVTNPDDSSTPQQLDKAAENVVEAGQEKAPESGNEQICLNPAGPARYIVRETANEIRYLNMMYEVFFCFGIFCCLIYLFISIVHTFKD